MATGQVVLTLESENGAGPGVSVTGRPLVLKLGGSLVETGRLAARLKLTTGAKRPVVIVPGGGPFADAVRRAQRRSRISDATAHRMAILGMHQMAELYFEMQPDLVAAETLAAMRRAWAVRKVPVWLPLRLASRDKAMPQDWSITSDGLAAWLARRLGAAELVLVKSCEVDHTATAEDLQRRGVVDPVFAEIVSETRLAWRVLGPNAMPELAGLLDAEAIAAKPRHRS